MPRNRLIQLGRRKSAGNVLDDLPDEADRAPAPVSASSTFRILERPDKSGTNGLSKTLPAKPIKRPFFSPLQTFKGSSTQDLAAGTHRSSGQTTVSNSGSSGHYDSSLTSARQSSSSTVPSSIDASRESEEEDLFAKQSKTAPMQRSNTDQSIDETPPPPPPPPPHSFTQRAARALSFGSRSGKAPSSRDAEPLMPALPSKGTLRRQEKSNGPQRERAPTASSYASTAKPEVSLSLASSDFGGDFSSMFETSAKRRSQEPPLPPAHTIGVHRTDSPPIFSSRTNTQPMSSTNSKTGADGITSPYSSNRRDSYEALLSNLIQISSNSASGSPQLEGSQTFMGGKQQGYSLLTRQDTSPELNTNQRNSPYASDPIDSRRDTPGFGSRQVQLDDEDRWARRVELHDPQEPSTPYKRATSRTTSSTTPSSSRKPAPSSPQDFAEGASIAARFLNNGSNAHQSTISTTISRNNRTSAMLENEELFDTFPANPISKARIQKRDLPQAAVQKRMTREQFEHLQRSGANSPEESDAEEPEDDYDDEEDDDDKAKQASNQRQRQEANMSVYRQQMQKVTGGGPSDLPTVNRPGMDRSHQSAPNLSAIHLGGMGGSLPPESVRGNANNDDEDDDVPLGILQAHGFPSANRPPARVAENDLTSQRRASVTGSVVGGGAGQGPLPPFARRLPVDPYYGSSVVNSAQRESLGMANPGSQMYTGAPPVPPAMPPVPHMGHPAGLVGVIAGEERAKAARRGSPNPITGNYGPTPLPSNMPQLVSGMPSMGARSMSMGNLQPPQIYGPSGGMIPPMPTMPGLPSMPSQMSMPGMPGMMGMQQMQHMGNDQMQQFMNMQMQVMQNMLTMQQSQMGMSPSTQMPVVQDPMGAQAFGQPGLAPPGRQSPASAASLRTMSMLNPPQDWDLNMNSARPRSAAQSRHNLSISGLSGMGDGPPAGYTPSIAPSERSNVGMPSRYRPVTSNGENINASRAQSMTSSTPTMLNTRKSNPELSQLSQMQTPTIRVVEKVKGTPRISLHSAPKDDEDENDKGWSEMRKKRQDRASRFGFGAKKSNNKADAASLAALYPDVD